MAAKKAAKKKTSRRGIPTIVELCNILQCSRAALYVWSKMDGAPQAYPDGSHDLAAWQKFVESRGLKPVEGDELNRGRLQAENLQRKNALLEIEIDEKLGKLIPVSEVEVEVTRMVHQFKGMIYTKLENALPPILEGMRAADIQIKQREAIAAAFAILEDDKWRRQRLKESPAAQ